MSVALLRQSVAVASLHVLLALCLLAVNVDIFSPYTPAWKEVNHVYAPSQMPIYNWANGRHVKALVRHINPTTFRSAYIADAADIIPLGILCARAAL